MTISNYPQIIDILHRDTHNLEYKYGLPTEGVWKKLDTPIESMLRSLPNPPDEVKLKDGYVVFTFVNLSRKMDLKPTYLNVRSV